VKGAVLFGWKRDIIRSRKNRYTYGFGVCRPFIEGQHDQSRNFKDIDGRKKCSNCFDILVTINDDLPIDKCVEHITSHLKTHSKVAYIPLFCTEDRDPKYTDIKGVELVGRFEIPRTKKKYGKKIIKHVYFGDTEIYVKVTDEASGEPYEKRFDFLSVRDV